jgi:hypothetical protein
MTTKHTPGPWRIEKRPGNEMEYHVVAEVRSPVALAKTLCNGLPVEVDRANARLIAAAPEMERNLALILEVSERNNYADYRAAVRELARAAPEKAGAA